MNTTNTIRIGKELGVDPNVILETSHGRRSIDVLKLLAPEKANWEYVCKMEGLMPTKFGSGAVEIPGARSLCASLEEASPKVPWAIVTSGTSPLVNGWLGILDLPKPHHLVSAEMVEHGKPDPEGYLKGAKELGLDPTKLLVLEDSPAGIKAGKDAGCRVLGIASTHTAKQVKDAGADWVVEDLRSVKMVQSGKDGSVTLAIANGWTEDGQDITRSTL